jgi:hypothetical protein
MIVISGDSWAVGTWREIENHQHEISGPGFVKYFEPARVVNLSIGGASNTQQLARFDQLSQMVPFRTHDEFYWVVTNPLRCITQQQELVEPWIRNIPGTVQQAFETLLHNFLDALNNRAVYRGITFNMIGGLCDLDSVDTDQYSNLKIAVPSWIKLLSAGHTSSMYITEHMGSISQLIHQNRPDLLTKWLDIVALAQDKDQLFQQLTKDQLFECYHPNATAHELLITRLQDQR